MSWQDVGVILVVGAAVYFLARKFLAPPARKNKPASFVPLSSLKKPSSRR